MLLFSHLNRRRRIVITTATIAALSLGGIAIGMSLRTTSPPPRVVVESGNSACPSVVSSAGHQDGGIRSGGVELPASESADWGRWTAAQRLEAVTALQSEIDLSPEIVTVLRHVVQDKGEDPMTRNNAANALVRQRHRDPTLASLFVPLMQDVTEDPVWRDYAIQFAATALDWSDSPQQIVQAIWGQAQDHMEARSGTALLHLHRVEQRQMAPLPDDYGRQIESLINDDGANSAARLTAVAIIGERPWPQGIAQVRDLLARPGLPIAIRRVVIASLGRSGEADDVPRLRPYTRDTDMPTRLAAHLAISTLTHRSAVCHGTAPHQADHLSSSVKATP